MKRSSDCLYFHVHRFLGLELIAQIHTTSTVREGWAGFRYNTSCKIEDHLASLKELSLEASRKVSTGYNTPPAVTQNSCSPSFYTLSLPPLAFLPRCPCFIFSNSQGKKAGAFLINSHSGCDSWSIEDARTFLRGALVIEKEVGLPIVHETHRRRSVLESIDSTHTRLLTEDGPS